MEVQVVPHPLLDSTFFVTELAAPLGTLASPPELLAMLAEKGPAPLEPDDAVRAAVRDLLRHGGFKPTGRSKPSSEYLLRESTEKRLAAINPVVDVCNVVSLWSGLPISVIDLDLSSGPWSIAIAPTGAKYVFNRSGQELDLGGLVCLFDGAGPCANAVKTVSGRRHTTARGERSR